MFIVICVISIVTFMIYPISNVKNIDIELIFFEIPVAFMTPTSSTYEILDPYDISGTRWYVAL